MTDSELATLGVDRATFDALVSRKISEIRGEVVKTVETRDGGEIEIAPRFETKAAYWVQQTLSTEDRIAERDIEQATSLDATPPQVWFKKEWRDFDRKDALLFTSTKDLTPDEHRKAIYARRVAAANEAAEKDAIHDRMLASVEQAARAAKSAESGRTPQTP